MKNMLKSASLFFCFTILLLVSCEEDKVFFDGKNGQSMAGFSTTTLDLPVSNEPSSVAILVDVTTVSDIDRDITLTVDETSTALANQYNIDQSELKIPAGSYNGIITVTGNFDNIPSDASFDLVLKLSSLQGASIAPEKSKITITLTRSCPVPSTFAVGSYRITQLTPGLPAAGGASAFLQNGTFDVSIGANPFQRKFTAKAYPSAGLGNPATVFTFQLVCGKVNAVGSYATGIGCTAGNSIVFTAGTIASSYDSDDDSVIEITFSEDPTDSCGDPQQTTIRLTKI